MSSNDDTKDYKIGYGRPPEQHQFKPGNNANPKGRPKGSRNRKLVVSEILMEPIAVRQGDKTTMMPKIAVAVQNQLNMALRSNLKAIEGAIRFGERNGVFAPREDQQDPEPLSDSDKEILADFIRRSSPKPDDE
jgi:hypothetical protein